MFEDLIQQSTHTGKKRSPPQQGSYKVATKISRKNKENSLQQQQMTSVTDQTSSTSTTSSPTLTSQQLTSDSTTSPPPPVSQAAALQSDIQLFESIIREEIDEGDTGNIISNLGNIDIQNFTKIITNKITQYLNVNESHPMIKQNKIFIINSIEELTPENLHLLTKLQIAISCRTMIGIKLNEIDILRDKIMARDSLIKSLIKEKTYFIQNLKIVQTRRPLYSSQQGSSNFFCTFNLQFDITGELVWHNKKHVYFIFYYFCYSSILYISFCSIDIN